jgi:hypothetical protein
MHKVPHILDLLRRRHAYTYVRKAASNGRIRSTNGAAIPVDNQSKPKIQANKTMCQNFPLSMLGRMGWSGVLAGLESDGPVAVGHKAPLALPQFVTIAAGTTVHAYVVHPACWHGGGRADVVADWRRCLAFRHPPSTEEWPLRY